MAERGIYVCFEHRPVEDRSESIAQGRPIFRDVEYAIITVAGGNSVVEKEVDDAIRARFKALYDAWRAGAEPPLQGMDLREWPAITRSKAEEMRALGIRTLEDLVAIPDTALVKTGPGARALQKKAQAWLDSARDTGTRADEMQGLRLEVTNLKTTLAERDETIAALKSEIEQVRETSKPRRRKTA